VAGALDLLESRADLDGVVNLSAPEPVTNVELMRIIRRALRMPVGLPAPRPVLEVGAWLIRTETELLLKSRWVVPERLLQAGYTLRQPALEGAIADIIAQSRPARRGGALAQRGGLCRIPIRTPGGPPQEQRPHGPGSAPSAAPPHR